REVEAYARGQRECLGIDARSHFEFDRRGKTQFERAEGHVDRVTRHVAERARAEVIPTAPGEIVIDTFLERAKWSRAEPEIPIHICRHLVFAFGPVQSLRPDRAIRPDVQLAWAADDARLNDLDGAAQPGSGA